MVNREKSLLTVCKPCQYRLSNKKIVVTSQELKNINKMKCLQSCFKIFSVNKDSFRTLNSQELECVDAIAHGFSACIAYNVLNVDVTSGSSPLSPRHNLFFF